MPQEFKLPVPVSGGASKDVTLKVGQVLYILGANGTGKSSLVSHLYNNNQSHAKRISAHRQTWLESNALDMTARNRQDLENNFRAQDAQARSRYWEWNGSGRSNAAIFDLIDADMMVERKIAKLVRSDDLVAAKKEADSPSPIQIINELMQLSNLPIEVGIEEGQKIVARKNGGGPYSVAELSDGERNAFLIAANVLTAKAGTLILVDEPERHLHRSIISPLLKLLFENKKDCAFIVSTHEVMLPLDMPSASTMLVRGCVYQGEVVREWVVDVLPPGGGVDDRLKCDVLGARRKILFVEGAAKSLDMPLYSLLFPQISVIPKGGCHDVEQAVQGLRGAPDMHWVMAWGVVDNDQRSPENIARLKESGVWALSHYSVESLYYHPAVIARVADRQAQVAGFDPGAALKLALSGAIAAARGQKEHLVNSTVLRSAREKLLSGLPNRADIEGGGIIAVEIDIPALRALEEARFNALVDAADWDGLLARYPLRESSAFDRIIAEIKMADRETYQASVLKLLQDDQAAVSELRGLLGDLYANVTA